MESTRGTVLKGKDWRAFNYPVNVLVWLELPILDTRIQYDRIDDVLNSVCKHYQSSAQEMVKDVFIATFVAGLSPEDIIAKGICGAGKWNPDRIIQKLKTDIRRNGFYMDYISLLRNTYQNTYDRIPCDVQSGTVTDVPSRMNILQNTNIWGIPEEQWIVIKSIYNDGMNIAAVSVEMGVSQGTVRKYHKLALETIKNACL